MPLLMVTGGAMACSFGAAPSTFSATGAAATEGDGPAAGTIMDNAPMANIAPFGMCSSLGNPTVAAATAAALGALTPQPCIPATAAPWTPGSATITIGGVPALHDGCTLTCSYGGVITVSFAGQPTVSIS